MARKIKSAKSNAVVAVPDSKASKSKRQYKAKTSPKVKTVPSQKTEHADLATSISVQEKVALLAYRYWEERGKQGGSAEEDWFRAEREILGQSGITDY
jgi:hypothetical protein